MKERIKMKIKSNRDIFLCLVISTVLLFIIYGEIIISANSTYFDTKGDGLQTYYSVLYHVKYDDSYSFFKGMAYPYGDHVLFASSQPLLTNTIKFISNNIVDISDYTVGFINLAMLFSIVFASLFLLLIFKNLNMPAYYSIPVAIGISFLSPQIYRMGAHFTLSYVCGIPGIIYFLMKFYMKPSWKRSIIIALFILILSSFHLYYYAFSVLILSFFWFVQILTDKKFRNYRNWLINIPIQIILPYFVLYLWLYYSGAATDRTSCPWGFLEYISGWKGIFFSDFFLLDSYLKNFLVPTHIYSMEGVAFIGHVAAFFYTFVFTIIAAIPFFIYSKPALFLGVVITGLLIQIFIKKRWNIFRFTDNKFLNIILGISFITLLVSFAWPFIFYPEMVHYIGIVKQLRALGRFSWLFFYGINIGAFYFLYNLNIKKWLKNILMVLALLVLFFDAFYNNKGFQAWLNNKMPELSENSPEYKWINSTDIKKYQALIPIPYFNIGSENIWVNPVNSPILETFIASLKTGLPTTGSWISRSSIGCSFKNIQLMLEAYRKPLIIKDFPDRRPFLLIVKECEEITEAERNIICKSVLLTKTPGYNVYEMPFSTLESLSDSLYYRITKEMDSKRLFHINNFYTTDSVKTFYYSGFDDSNIPDKLFGQGCFKGNIADYNTIFYGNIPGYKCNSEYLFSFWVYNVFKDLYPRTYVEIIFMDKQNKVYSDIFRNIGFDLKVIDGNWALYEYKFKLAHAEDLILVILKNYDLTSDVLVIDNLMIRPKDNDIFLKTDNCVFKNNRIYCKKLNKNEFEKICDNIKTKNVIGCNAENTTSDKSYFLSDDKNVKICNGFTQNDEIFHSGKYSSKLTKEMPYGMTVNIADVKVGDLYKITAWRYSKNKNGVIVISSDDNNEFYLNSDQVIKKETNGWEQVSLNYKLNKTIKNNKLIIYLWNNRETPVFFDDMKIEVQSVN